MHLSGFCSTAFSNSLLMTPSFLRVISKPSSQSTSSKIEISFNKSFGLSNLSINTLKAVKSFQLI